MVEQSTASPSHTSRRRVLIVSLVILAVALVGLRLALPTLVKNYLNDQIADMGDYQGHIEDVDIALWRGAYALHRVDIVKVDQEVPVPFFAANSVDLAIAWRALLRGVIVAEMAFYAPELHFVDGGDEASQDGSGTDWRLAVQELTAIRIDEVNIYDGQLYFHNFQSEPEVNLALSDLEGNFTNLSNADRRETAVYADFQMDGRMLSDATVSLAGNLDPLGDLQDFVFALRITGIELVELNDLTEAYGNFDFESGNGDFVMELEAEGGALNGYARPLLDNVAILDLESDSGDGLFSVAWEAVVAGLGQIFRNQPADRIATEIEISGNLNQQDVSAWQAFRSLLRNAFVEAYELQFGQD